MLQPLGDLTRNARLDTQGKLTHSCLTEGQIFNRGHPGKHEAALERPVSVGRTHDRIAVQFPQTQMIKYGL